ncbi:FadR/GntR family transcriptional regulator [Microbacterium oleivorans]|uniref:FadR/GntR family transcriptional regulator n=1 Tax=Microbacterium oleivorans TaxID=273677 RepID=UPI000767134A|nr:FadR/GntR family transcriptional regulator [Microbacterium oleivorans]
MDWSTLRRGKSLSVPDMLSVNLERLILNGELKTGEKLPNERELAELLGASRVSIRQALHELEARGMIDRRPGRGTVVVDPSEGVGSAGAGISAVLAAEGTGELQRIMELRAMIEPPIAALAASRVTARDVEQLRAYIADMESEFDLERYSELDRAFHQAIAQYTHNPLLSQLTDLIATEIAPSRRRTLQTPERRETSNAAHRAIFEAIAERDSERAEAEARAHVQTVFSQILRAQAQADAATEQTS